MRSSMRATLALATMATAYELPANLKAIYDQHKSGTCANSLSETFDGGAKYCGDIPNAIFLKGGNGEYDNMDIDCDGANHTAGDCANDPTGQGQTAFKWIVENYGIEDLDANLHSFVVFGTSSWNAEEYGLEPLSVMAVVCDDQVFYGVWGDTNGERSTGETSLALAKLCFPDEPLNGNYGHSENDVLYIGFPGSEGVPGADGAAWAAGSPTEFQDSIRSIGEKLVASL